MSPFFFFFFFCVGPETWFQQLISWVEAVLVSLSWKAKDTNARISLQIQKSSGVVCEFV